jgi:hypothetical protein
MSLAIWRKVAKGVFSSSTTFMAMGFLSLTNVILWTCVRRDNLNAGFACEAATSTTESRGGGVRDQLNIKNGEEAHCALQHLYYSIGKV